jgi:hypothetical protein
MRLQEDRRWAGAAAGCRQEELLDLCERRHFRHRSSRTRTSWCRRGARLRILHPPRTASPSFPAWRMCECCWFRKQAGRTSQLSEKSFGCFTCVEHSPEGTVQSKTKARAQHLNDSARDSGMFIMKGMAEPPRGSR